MPTPQIKKRLPAAMSLKERLSKNVQGADSGHLKMNGSYAASAGTPTPNAMQPAGQHASLEGRD